MTPSWKKPSASPARHADPDAAIVAYLEELRQAEMAGAPTPAAALHGLGDAHLDKGDVVSAIDYYRQAAEVYEREGMHDNAIACCKKIRRYASDDLEVGLMLGRYYVSKGLRADAVAELETYAERQSRAGRSREAIEALREVARLAPDRAGRREQLARLLAEDGQREEARDHYASALEAYRAAGDEVGVARARAAIVSLDAAVGPAPPLEVEASVRPLREARPSPRLEVPAEPSPPEVEAGPAGARELGIEPTSYEEGELLPAGAAAEIETVDEKVRPERPEEALSLAEQLAAAGQVDSAGVQLTAAADGFQSARRWPEAIAAYRRLAQLERATPDDFAAWAECARQAGEASKVLEALAVSARWHLARGDRQGARRAAEEMLLVDPHSGVALDLMEQVGASLPRG